MLGRILAWFFRINTNEIRERHEYYHRKIVEALERGDFDSADMWQQLELGGK